MDKRSDELLNLSYGAALLLASIYARVATMEARGEKPPACWEDGSGCARGIIACALGDASLPDGCPPVATATATALVERLCAIAADCGVAEPAGFFS